MRYVLGVDGGQMTTTAVVADETGCLLGFGHGGAARSGLEAGGISRAQKALTEAVQGAVQMADLENARIAAACVGLSGNGAQNDALETICAPAVQTSHLILGQPARIALYCVTFGKPGVVVRAGVGTATYGLNAQGEEAQGGGWGGLLGDEGSAYWIAVRALNACCRAHDRIDPPTLLPGLILKHLEMEDIQQARQEIAAHRLQDTDIAALAEIVSRAAAQGDKTARRILREAGKELALSAQAMLRRLKLEQEPVMVGTVGGVFRAGRAVLRTFREMVKQTAPNATIAPARVPPAIGAALIALEAIDVPLREELCLNLETALPRLSAVKV